MKFSNQVTITFLATVFVASPWFGHSQAAMIDRADQVNPPASQTNDRDSDPFGGGGHADSDPFGNPTPVSKRVAINEEPDAKENRNQPTIRTTEEIEQKLKEPVTMSFDQTPFGDVMNDLRDRFGINVIVDLSAREDSLNEDSLVYFDIRDSNLATALRLLLAENNATYMIDSGVLRIISLDVADDPDFLRRKIFDCTDLLLKIKNSDSRVGQPIVLPAVRGEIGNSAGGGGVFAVEPQGLGSNGQSKGNAGGDGNGRPFAQTMISRITPQQLLMNLIRTSVDPESWDECGGDGTMMSLGGLLVVSQSQDCLESIEQLISNLNRTMD